VSPSKPVIAMVTDAIAPYHWGGKEQRYRALAPRLTSYAEMHVYTMHWWDGPRTMTQDNVTYHAICPRLALYKDGHRSIAQGLLFALACLRLLFQPFDVLEADHMPYLQLFPLKLVSSLRRKRFVVTWHEVWDAGRWIDYIGPAGRFAWWLECLSMRLPDCIIAASAQTAERIQRRVGRDVPVLVAANGVDLELISRVPPSSELVDMVGVGRLLSHKRFDLLIDCVALLATAGTPLSCRIIGDGPEREALIMQADRLGVSHLVEFRHDVDSQEALFALVKAARLFIFPSEREGFGIAALEAIACGVPVITTSAPDNLARHLVERSDRGVICEPTAAALAATVASATSQDDDEREHSGDDWAAVYDWTAVTAIVAGALIGPRSAESGGPFDPAGVGGDCSRSGAIATPAGGR
jgi:glycosyltransferase involved in cell wall biosynthesis